MSDYTIRPFSRIVHIAAGTDLGESASAISLIDASGVALECNWVKIQSLSACYTQGAVFFMGASGAQHQRGDGAATLIRNIYPGVSATLGLVGSLSASGAPPLE